MSGPVIVAGVRPALTEKEAARELFVAGYLQALDDASRALGPLTTAEQAVIRRLREKAAGVQARAAIAKATGGAS